MTAETVRDIIRAAIAGEKPLADRGNVFHRGRVHALQFVTELLDEIDDGDRKQRGLFPEEKTEKEKV